jgi:hypothetical protein
MAPELPAMFSTTTDWPHASPNFWANMRAVTSVALPAVKPTTSFTGLSGQLVWAAAGSTARATIDAARTRRNACIVYPPFDERIARDDG